jgi:hypothetical protein
MTQLALTRQTSRLLTKALHVRFQGHAWNARELPNVNHLNGVLLVCQDVELSSADAEFCAGFGNSEEQAPGGTLRVNRWNGRGLIETTFAWSRVNIGEVGRHRSVAFYM